jgi:hypothetical protein
VTERVSPIVHAYAATARRNRPVGLRYRAYDNSGRATVSATVYLRDGRIQARKSASVKADNSIRTVSWRLGKAGRYLFCVRASDAARNVSDRSCARLTVKK